MMESGRIDEEEMDEIADQLEAIHTVATGLVDWLSLSMTDNEASDTEMNQLVYLAFVNGTWPEEPTKLLGVYSADADADAEAIAKDVGEAWHNWFVVEQEILDHPVVKETQSL